LEKVDKGRRKISALLSLVSFSKLVMLVIQVSQLKIILPTPVTLKPFLTPGTLP
jgi:hypothetical protein